MNKEKIYKMLNEKGVNSTMIAISLGISKQSVHQVISEGKGSKRIAKAISKVCETELETLFPFYAKEQNAQKTKAMRQKALDEKLAKLA